MSNGDYIRPSEVARKFGVSRGAVYKWIREGKLKAVKLGPNAVRIPRAALEEFERKALDLSYTSEDIQGPIMSLALLPA